MKLDYRARFKAYSLALAHLKDNEEITKDIPAFAEAWQSAQATLDAVAAADNLRQESRQAIMIGKKKFREDISNRALELSAAIVSYATGNKDLQLKEAMNFTRSELVHVNDSELGAKTSNILAAAKALNGQLKPFGISDEVLTAYARMVEQYLQASNQPRNTVAIRKEAGQFITRGLNEVRDKLKNQLDKLMLQFRFTHTDFYNQYIEMRTVIYPGQRKTQLEGLVSEEGSQAGLGNVEVLVNGTPLVTLTQADGTFVLKMPPVSNATVEFKKEGYTTVTVQLDIKRGQKVWKEISMQRNT